MRLKNTFLSKTIVWYKYLHIVTQNNATNLSLLNLSTRKPERFTPIKPLARIKMVDLTKLRGPYSQTLLLIAYKLKAIGSWPEIFVWSRGFTDICLLFVCTDFKNIDPYSFRTDLDQTNICNEMTEPKNSNRLQKLLLTNVAIGNNRFCFSVAKIQFTTEKQYV